MLEAVNFGIRREMERRQRKQLSESHKNTTAGEPRMHITDLPNWLLDSTECAVLSPSEERALELTA